MNFMSGNLVKSPPPYSLCSLLTSSERFFWYAGPASTIPPEDLRKPWNQIFISDFDNISELSLHGFGPWFKNLMV